MRIAVVASPGKHDVLRGSGAHGGELLGVGRTQVGRGAVFRDRHQR
jgi:hypothetical protein